MKKIYEEEDQMVRPREDQDDPPLSFVGVQAEEYQMLIDILEKKGLVAIQALQPKVVNGVFAVPKDEVKQRLIIDSRPANAVLRPPPEVKLRNPGLLARLHIDFEGYLHFCKSDMDNFYHRLSMPTWLHQYFVRPSIRREGRNMWPVVQVPQWGGHIPLPSVRMCML